MGWNLLRNSGSSCSLLIIISSYKTNSLANYIIPTKCTFHEEVLRIITVYKQTLKEKWDGFGGILLISCEPPTKIFNFYTEEQVNNRTITGDYQQNNNLITAR